MPLDIIQQDIYTGSINIRLTHVIHLSLSLSTSYLTTPHFSLHRIGCKHIPSYFAFPKVQRVVSPTYSSNFLLQYIFLVSLYRSSMEEEDEVCGRRVEAQKGTRLSCIRADNKGFVSSPGALSASTQYTGRLRSSTGLQR